MLEQLWEALIRVAREVAVHSGSLQRVGFSIGASPQVVVNEFPMRPSTDKTVWMHLDGELSGFPAEAAVV